MAVVLALISALSYGTGDYCGGRATRSLPLLRVSLVTQSTSASLALVAVLVQGVAFPGGADVAWSVAAGLMSLLGIFTFYEALARGSMTVVAPFTAVVSAVVPVVVGVASGERPSVLASGGVVLALVAVPLVSGVGGRAERATPRRIAALAFVAGLGFGLLFVFLDRTSDDSGLWPLAIGQVTAWTFVVVAVLARRPSGRDVGSDGRTGAHLLAVTAGVSNIVANVAYLQASRAGLLSLVAVITSLYPGTTVAFATVLDHERMSRVQTAGLVLAVGAVAMVGVGG